MNRSRVVVPWLRFGICVIVSCMIEMFTAHLRKLKRLLRRSGRSPEDTEDLLQETFLRVKRYVDEGGEIQEPEAFLVRTALNLSRDAARREHRQLYSRKPLEQMLIIDAGPTPQEIFEAEQRLERLSRALNKAGPRTREVFIMHRLHGMTYAQIASRLGLTVSSIEKYVARAVEALAGELMEP